MGRAGCTSCVVEYGVGVSNIAMWDCRSVFIIEKDQSLLFFHIEPSRNQTISRDDGEGGMHVLRC